MQLPFTSPPYPPDIIARWTLVESNLTQGHEEHLLSLCRHVALGCALCRQEEVIEYLIGWPRELCTPREALLLLDVLMLYYLFSRRGLHELALLRRGMTPTLRHTDAGPARDDGFPDDYV